MVRVFVKTLGCKVNTFDSHALENQFREAACTIVDSPEAADISVVNTCSVTNEADKEARYLARRFRRESPDSLVVMTGCYAQTDSKKLSAINEVDVIVPNEVKEQLVAFTLQQLATKQKGETFQRWPESVNLVDENRQGHFKSSLAFFDRAESHQTRAFIKIQDGCNGFCSYCLIPYARGASRSVDPNLALAEVKRQIALGSQEIVLTGIHIGDYGTDLESMASFGEDSFVEFMKRLFDLEGLGRVRISSLEPAELSLSLIKVLAQHRDKFCDHFHLPMQSGSDRILKLMNRKYTKERYLESCMMAKEYFPSVCIGADIIPGFPSETHSEHEETMRFVEECQLDYLHVFPYSKRPNTAAARMPHHLESSIVKSRAKELRELSKVTKKKFLDSRVGMMSDVVWEKDLDSQGRRIGISKDYVSVVSGQKEQPQSGARSIVKLLGFVAEERLLGVSAVE
jgi:threonylcarbamoyladenosine tRNA methylthiotransferase MtaB